MHSDPSALHSLQSPCFRSHASEGGGDGGGSELAVLQSPHRCGQNAAVAPLDIASVHTQLGIASQVLYARPMLDEYALNSSSRSDNRHGSTVVDVAVLVLVVGAAVVVGATVLITATVVDAAVVAVVGTSVRVVTVV